MTAYKATRACSCSWISTSESTTSQPTIVSRRISYGPLMPSLPGRSRWLCASRFSEKWRKYRYLCLNLVSFWRENRDIPLQKVYLSLDLGAEPCNNYAVQTGRVWGCGSLAEVRLQEGESLE